MRNQLKTFFWLLGGGIILVLIIGGYVGVQGNPSMVENTYIENIQRQDYEGAFRSIDAQHFTINSQPTTQAQFIQEAQAIDSHEGKITSVREENMSTNSENSGRTITCIFSRGRKSYSVHLLLKIINDNSINPLVDNYPYKIVSVSRL